MYHKATDDDIKMKESESIELLTAAANLDSVFAIRKLIEKYESTKKKFAYKTSELKKWQDRLSEIDPQVDEDDDD
jgi:hypothetical protein